MHAKASPQRAARSFAVSSFTSRNNLVFWWNCNLLITFFLRLGDVLGTSFRLIATFLFWLGDV